MKNIMFEKIPAESEIYILVLAVVFCLNQNALADPVENDFGIVNAWYNGQEATVKNISLKIGEPFEITVYVYSKIDCNVYIKLINPLVTVPYDIVSGPSELDKFIDNHGVNSGWSENYTWIIAPNGEWTNGNAPINIFVQFSDQGDDRREKFTIANPIILDEQYSGSNPSHTTTTSSSTSNSRSFILFSSKLSKIIPPPVVDLSYDMASRSMQYHKMFTNWHVNKPSLVCVYSHNGNS